MSRRAAAAALAVVAAAAVAAPQAGAATADGAAAARAARWLAANTAGAAPGQQADAVVALRAAGRPAASLRPRLAALASAASAYATTAGGAAKVAMAAVAAGRDPRSVGRVDMLARIRSRYANGRYGATAWDQALSMLALEAAGRPVPQAAVRLALAARGSGGWGLRLVAGERDSVDATSIVLEALAGAGVRASQPGVRAGVRWLLAQRNREGGLASAGGGAPTEANSTAAAIRALRALHMRPPPATRAALRRLQEPDGAIRFTRRDPGSRLIATLDAVIALAGRTLPVR